MVSCWIQVLMTQKTRFQLPRESKVLFQSLTQSRIQRKKQANIKNQRWSRNKKESGRVVQVQAMPYFCFLLVWQWPYCGAKFVQYFLHQSCFTFSLTTNSLQEFLRTWKELQKARKRSQKIITERRSSWKGYFKGNEAKGHSIFDIKIFCSQQTKYTSISFFFLVQ